MVDQVRFLNQRFKDVIIAIKRKSNIGKVIPIRVHKFLNDDEDGTIIIRYNNIGSDNIVETTFYEDDYILDCPKVGMVGIGKKTMYLRRIPERQWKRGYNSSIIRGETLCNKENIEMGLNRVNIMNNSIVDAIYNPDYPNFNEALNDMIKGKLLSFPISRKFAVGLNYDAAFPVIYYKEWVVGWVDEGTIMLPEKTHHLYEELSQYTECRRV